MKSQYNAEEEQIEIDLTDDDVIDIIKEDWFKLSTVFIEGKEYKISLGRER